MGSMAAGCMVDMDRHTRACISLIKQVLPGVTLSSLCGVYHVHRIRFVPMNKTPAAFQTYLVRLTSGPHTGRYIGQKIGGFITEPSFHTDPPIDLIGTKYMIYTQEQAAIRFFETSALEVNAQLQKVGISAELVAVTA
jgi:hypothetical protein